MTSFETPEESARASAILAERDAFRLVIRGHALVEEFLDRAINDAFRDGTPAELRRLRLPARLALAEALELITTQVSTAIATFAKVRNRLAHGGDDAVTAQELEHLHAAAAPFLGDDIDLRNYDEDDQLRILVWALAQATSYTVEYALAKRQEAEAVLDVWQRRNALTGDQIRELLEGFAEPSPEAVSRFVPLLWLRESTPASWHLPQHLGRRLRGCG
jgi:hypothetical protein